MRSFKLRKQFLANVLQVFRGTAIAQAILLAVTPVLTRLFSPEAFGELVMYQAILTFGLVGSALRYEYAILLPDDTKVATDLVLIGLFVSAMISALLLIVAAVVNWQSVDIAPGFSSVLIYVPIALLLGGWAQTLNFLALREKNFRVTANAKIARSISLSVISLTGGSIRASGSTLMLADVFGKLVALVLLWNQLSDKVIRHLKDMKWSQLLATAGRYKLFPKVSLPSSMINTAAFSLTPLMMAANFGLVVAGLYALVDRVLGAPSALIGTAVGQVYMTELAEYKRTSPHKASNLFLKVTMTQAKLAIIPVVIISIVAPDLFSLVFGEAWRESGAYVRPLALLYFLSFVFTPIGATLTVLEHQKRQLYWDTSRLAAILVAWSVIAWLDLSALIGLLVFSLTMSVFIVVYLGLCLLSFKQLEQAT